MALKLEDKKAFVKEINAVAEDSVTAVAAEYRGLTVEEMTELRKEARSAGVYLRVVKNSLAKRAVVKDFAKGHEALQAVSLSAGGQLLPGSDLAKLAELPTMDQARAILLGVFVAPMSQLVRTFAEPPAMLARTMSARGDQEAA